MICRSHCPQNTACYIISQYTIDFTMRKMKEASNSIQVIERLARLLDVIAMHKDSASLKTLSAETGLHPSTAFRILASLAEQGFVERTSRGNYKLGAKLMQLGSLVSSTLDIRKVALPLMEKLRNQLGE